MPYLGPIPDEVWEVLLSAWDLPIYIASNFARAQRHAVALAASIGWISNIAPDGLDYSDRWHLTHSGAQALENHSLKP